jgi:hypothetical protein
MGTIPNPRRPYELKIGDPVARINAIKLRGHQRHDLIFHWQFDMRTHDLNKAAVGLLNLDWLCEAKS